MKQRGERFTMLTAYDMYTAEIFDEAGIEVLLVGDSASNNVYGNETSLPVTVDELIPLTRAVSRSVKRSLVVGDLPFGSYQRSPEQAYDTAVRFMKEGGAHAVKLEGGREMAPQIELLSRGGVPVMAHIGFTPQSEHALGGYRVQGRGDTGDRILDDARAVEAAGAFAVVMEMVPGDVAGQVTKELTIPTIGIGAGVDCDAQVLVWQDAFGLRGGRMARFVKQYADVRGVLLDGGEGLRRRRQVRRVPRSRAHLLRARSSGPGEATTCGRSTCGASVPHATPRSRHLWPGLRDHRPLRFPSSAVRRDPTRKAGPHDERLCRQRGCATPSPRSGDHGSPAGSTCPGTRKYTRGGRLLITERADEAAVTGDHGKLRRVAFPASSVWASGETGLMSLAIDPGYARRTVASTPAREARPREAGTTSG